MSNFNPEIFQCTDCEGTMRSSYPGQFVRCSCGNSFVDQTMHYGRYGGSARAVSYLVLKDLKAISGIGYEKDDVLDLLEEVAYRVFTPTEAVQREIYRQYESGVADLGGSSPKDLVEAGRGHKVIQYIQALLEGY